MNPKQARRQAATQSMRQRREVQAEHGHALPAIFGYVADAMAAARPDDWVVAYRSPGAGEPLELFYAITVDPENQLTTYDGYRVIRRPLAESLAIPAVRRAARAEAKRADALWRQARVIYDSDRY